MCTHNPHMQSFLHSRALLPLIPPTPCSHKKEQGEVGRPEAQNESRNTGAPKEPAPVGRGRSALAGWSKAGCALPMRARHPCSQACGRDARAPRRGKMLAFPACGRDARAPRWGRMPALPGMRARRPRSQARQDARVPGMRARRPRSQVGQDARVPGMRARRPRSQARQDARVPGMRARRPRSQVGQDARVPGMRSRRPRPQAVQGRERLQRARNMVFESLFRCSPRRRASPHAPRTRGVGGLSRGLMVFEEIIRHSPRRRASP